MTRPKEMDYFTQSLSSSFLILASVTPDSRWPYIHRVKVRKKWVIMWQWFSARGDLGPSGDLWQHLSICHHWRSVTGVSRVEASYEAKEDTEEPPQQRMIQTQESTEVEKPCPWPSPVITSRHLQSLTFKHLYLDPASYRSSSLPLAPSLQKFFTPLRLSFHWPHFSLSVTCLHPS